MIQNIMLTVPAECSGMLFLPQYYITRCHYMLASRMIAYL